MGLDTVELVLSFEALFQITIPDREAEKMRTPRDVIDFIVNQLEVKVSGPAKVVPEIPESVRSRLIEAIQGLGFNGGPVPVEEPLDDVFSNRSLRHRQWQDLRSHVKAQAWPSLRWFGLSTNFPKGLRTVGDLVDWLVQVYALPLTAQQLRDLTRDDVALLVKWIALSELGLPEKRYGEDKRFVEDFGAD